MNKHTPGPWGIGFWGTFADIGPGPAMVCTIELSKHARNVGELKANAQLIAAAPELLDELIAAYLRAHPCPTCGGVEVLGGGLARCSCCDQPWAWDQFTPTPEWQSSRAAIAKATGGSNE